MKSQFLEIYKIREIIEKNLDKQFCIQDPQSAPSLKSVKTDYNDNKYEIILINNSNEMEVTGKVFINDIKDPYVIITTNYYIDKNGIHLDNNLSDGTIEKFDENTPSIDENKLIKVLFVHLDTTPDKTSFSEVFFKTEEGTYSFELLNLDDIKKEGFLVTDDTLLFEEEKNYLQAITLKRNEIENFDEKAKNELYERLEWSWDEIEKEHYHIVWDGLKDKQDFVSLMIRENFDLGDTLTRETLADLIDNLNIDWYD